MTISLILPGKLCDNPRLGVATASGRPDKREDELWLSVLIRGRDAAEILHKDNIS
jgi:hypothetical protein